VVPRFLTEVNAVEGGYNWSSPQVALLLDLQLSKVVSVASQLLFSSRRGRDTGLMAPIREQKTGAGGLTRALPKTRDVFILHGGRPEGGAFVQAHLLLQLRENTCKVWIRNTEYSSVMERLLSLTKGFSRS
jgi:hypothetical protein